MASVWSTRDTSFFLFFQSAILSALVTLTSQQLNPPDGVPPGPPSLASPYQGAQLNAASISSPPLDGSNQPQSVTLEKLSSMTPQQLATMNPQQRLQLQKLMMQQHQQQLQLIQQLQQQLKQTQQRVATSSGGAKDPLRLIEFTGLDPRRQQQVRQPNTPYLLSAANRPQGSPSKLNLQSKESSSQLSPPLSPRPLFPPPGGAVNPAGPPYPPGAGTAPTAGSSPEGARLDPFIAAAGRGPVKAPAGIPPPLPPEIMAKLNPQQREQLMREHMQRLQQQQQQQQQQQRQHQHQQFRPPPQQQAPQPQMSPPQNPQGHLPPDLRAFLMKKQQESQQQQQQQQQQPPQPLQQPPQIGPPAQTPPGQPPLPPELMAHLMKQQQQNQASPVPGNLLPRPSPPGSPLSRLSMARGGPQMSLPGGGQGLGGLLRSVVGQGEGLTQGFSGDAGPTRCPRVLQRETCSGRFHRCQKDEQCSVGSKCCLDPCGMICKKAEPVNSSGLPGSLLVASCITPNCGGTWWAPSRGRQSDCDAIKSCRRDHTCCFNGCRNICRHKDASQGLFGNLFGKGGGKMDKNTMMLMMAAGGA